MNDFIGKPFSPEQLYAVLEKWVTGLGDGVMFDAKTHAQLDGRALSLPSNIDGIDIRAGLRRVAGMRGLYLKTLRRFLDDQQDLPASLRQLVAAGDIAAAVRAAHTLKGASGMIEAREVYGLALGVEQLLQAGDTEAGLDLIARLEVTLTPLLESLRAALERDRMDTDIDWSRNI